MPFLSQPVEHVDKVFAIPTRWGHWRAASDGYVSDTWPFFVKMHGLSPESTKLE